MSNGPSENRPTWFKNLRRKSLQSLTSSLRRSSAYQGSSLKGPNHLSSTGINNLEGIVSDSSSPSKCGGNSRAMGKGHKQDRRNGNSGLLGTPGKIYKIPEIVYRTLPDFRSKKGDSRKVPV